MGISGLFKNIGPACRPCNIAEFANKVVVIDISPWLYKGGAKGVSLETATELCVNYCSHRIKLLQSYNITPIVVFDGAAVPAKQITRIRRVLGVSWADAEEINKDYDHQGGVSKIDIFRRAIIDKLQMMNCCYIVAPFEADGQVAFFALHGAADFVISDDSDLAVYGCRFIVSKLDASGNGTFFDATLLPNCIVPRELHLFRWTCILAGSDYWPGYFGIGIKKASEFVTLIKPDNFPGLLEAIPSIFTSKQPVPDDCLQNFKKAEEAFLYPIIFNPFLRLQEPLNQYPSNQSFMNFPNNGVPHPAELILDLALGNIEHGNYERVGMFDLDSEFYVLPPSHIWSPGFMEWKETKPVVDILPLPISTTVNKDDGHLCFFCGKRFKHLSWVKDHERVHFDEKKYPCTKCHKTFKSGSSLYGHVASAHSENYKPYKCPTCEETFTDQWRLRHHKDAKHSSSKKYMCDFCGYSAKFRPNLDQHLQLHQLDEDGAPQLFKCKFCPSVYQYSSGLSKHMGKKHKNISSTGSTASAAQQSVAQDVPTKPTLSKTQIIIQALALAPNNQLTAKGIYDYFSSTYPFFSADDEKWKKHVRSQLSTDKKFVNPGKVGFWRIDPAQEAKLINEAFTKRSQRGVYSHSIPSSSTQMDAPIVPPVAPNLPVVVDPAAIVRPLKRKRSTATSNFILPSVDGPKSDFLLFCDDERDKVKGMNPEYGIGDVAKELGRLWALVPPEKKQKYQAMSDKDKARYEREMHLYKSNPVAAGHAEDDDEEEVDDEY